MTEEEIDVEEACDAGLVDREDLVDARSKLYFLLFCSATILQQSLCYVINDTLPMTIRRHSSSRQVRISCLLVPPCLLYLHQINRRCLLGNHSAHKHQSLILYPDRYL